MNSTALQQTSQHEATAIRPPLRDFFAGIALLVAGVLLVGASSALAGDRKKMTGKIDARVIYHNYCSVCHGDAGDGNSRAKASLVPAPANFTDPALQGKLTREYMAAVVRDGKPGTAMVGWKTQLNDQEVAAVVDYLRTQFVERAGDNALRKGRTLYGHLCVNCHGIDGKGASAKAAGLSTPPRDLTTEDARRSLTRDRLTAVIALGRKGTAMNGFSGQLSPADLEALVDFVQKGLMTGGGAAISGTAAHGGRERDARAK